MTGGQTADLLIALGAERGLMLDGGGSTAMHIDREGIVSQPSDGSTRAVANQLIFEASADWIE
jgi:exopolysaccharide biosynthesis protein